MKNLIYLFILGVTFSFSLSIHASSTDIAKWSLPSSQKPNEEFLLYRLSFRGLFTAYVWKELSDTVFIADSNVHQFNKKSSCQLHLKMSSEDFLISELFSPTRYHWRTSVTPDLKRVLLFEEINENHNDIHNVMWANKKKKRLELYHKRKKIRVYDQALDDDEFENQKPKMVWEKDKKRKAPKFLSNKPKVNGKLNYLVYDESIKVKGKKSVFDPLALIYSARWYNYDSGIKPRFTISYKDTLRKYHVNYKGKEIVKIGNEKVESLRIEIRRNKKESREDEGFMVIWLSNDERRIPLEYKIKIRLGTIKIKIDPNNFKNYKTPVHCINTKNIFSQMQ